MRNVVNQRDANRRYWYCCCMCVASTWDGQAGHVSGRADCQLQKHSSWGAYSSLSNFRVYERLSACPRLEIAFTKRRQRALLGIIQLAGAVVVRENHIGGRSDRSGIASRDERSGADRAATAPVQGRERAGFSLSRDGRWSIVELLVRLEARRSWWGIIKSLILTRGLTAVGRHQTCVAAWLMWPG